jgi:hypothetical protein
MPASEGRYVEKLDRSLGFLPQTHRNEWRRIPTRNRAVDAFFGGLRNFVKGGYVAGPLAGGTLLWARGEALMSERTRSRDHFFFMV